MLRIFLATLLANARVELGLVAPPLNLDNLAAPPKTADPRQLETGLPSEDAENTVSTIITTVATGLILAALDEPAKHGINAEVAGSDSDYMTGFGSDTDFTTSGIDKKELEKLLELAKQNWTTMPMKSNAAESVGGDILSGAIHTVMNPGLWMKIGMGIMDAMDDVSHNPINAPENSEVAKSHDAAESVGGNIGNAAIHAVANPNLWFKIGLWITQGVMEAFDDVSHNPINAPENSEVAKSHDAAEYGSGGSVGGDIFGGVLHAITSPGLWVQIGERMMDVVSHNPINAPENSEVATHDAAESVGGNVGNAAIHAVANPNLWFKIGLWITQGVMEAGFDKVSHNPINAPENSGVAKSHDAAESVGGDILSGAIHTVMNPGLWMKIGMGIMDAMDDVSHNPINAPENSEIAQRHTKKASDAENAVDTIISTNSAIWVATGLILAALDEPAKHGINAPNSEMAGGFGPHDFNGYTKKAQKTISDAMYCPTCSSHPFGGPVNIAITIARIGIGAIAKLLALHAKTPIDTSASLREICMKAPKLAMCKNFHPTTSDHLASRLMGYEDAN